MKKIFTLFVLLLLIYAAGYAQGFEIKNGQFVLNGKPLRIYGGEVHYARIPREYWRQRIQMVKALGCNAISIYVFWNYHEPEPGVWDWQTGSHDLRAFIETARDEGMYIILRPGPYTCAEWEFGGFPYWLVNAKLRTADAAFTDSCRTYLKQVFKQVDGLFAEQGGNILMTQAENEYGFYAMATGVSKHKADEYKKQVVAAFRDAGFTHTLFTCDGGIVPVVNFAQRGHIKGLFPGTNDSKFLDVARHTVKKYFGQNGPYYIPEEYAGWFTHWGDAHMFHRDVMQYKTHVEQLLKSDFSFCYYMVHGGTNFGFMNGANTTSAHAVQPVITSYDYGAPINEAGRRTPLYDSLRAVYQRTTNTLLPPVPDAPKTIGIDSIALAQVYPLFNALGSFDSVTATAPLTFEQLHQGYGYVVYRKNFTAPLRGNLATMGITDYAIVYVNDSPVATINRYLAPRAVPKSIAVNIPAGGSLTILVENMGRINFGKKLLSNARGVTHGISISGKPVTDWLMYKLPPQSITKIEARAHVDYVRSHDKMIHLQPGTQQPVPLPQYTYHANTPLYYVGSFTLNQAGDTYLDMHGFGKGAVWVNGYCLGRYWDIGPQYSLYVPGVWLHKGPNTVIIFDEVNHTQQHYISASPSPHDN